jgi:hypothetical protein
VCVPIIWTCSTRVLWRQHNYNNIASVLFYKWCLNSSQVTKIDVILQHRMSLTFGAGILHLIQINHQPDATIFQFIILTFVYSSTRFGRFPAHHQELNDCSGSLWFYRPAGPTTNTARLSPRYEDKTRGCHCSHWALDDGRENARNMLSCKQTSG